MSEIDKTILSFPPSFVRREQEGGRVRSVDSTPPLFSPSVSGVPQGRQGEEVDGKKQSFESVLEQQKIQFSKHAEKRLQSRNLSLTETDRLNLEEAMGRLEQKGARDSLVLMGQLAFVVNVPSKTVVTALGKEQMKNQIFTNIDSTIWVE